MNNISSSKGVSSDASGDIASSKLGLFGKLDLALFEFIKKTQNAEYFQKISLTLNNTEEEIRKIIIFSLHSFFILLPFVGTMLFGLHVQQVKKELLLKEAIAQKIYSLQEFKKEEDNLQVSLASKINFQEESTYKATFQSSLKNKGVNTENILISPFEIKTISDRVSEFSFFVEFSHLSNEEFSLLLETFYRKLNVKIVTLEVTRDVEKKRIKGKIQALGLSFKIDSTENQGEANGQ